METTIEQTIVSEAIGIPKDLHKISVLFCTLTEKKQII